MFQPFQPPQADPYPNVPWAQQTDFRLLCDCCNQEILIEEEAINFLYGKVIIGERNKTPMVGPDERIPRGEVTLHAQCLAVMIIDDMPWVADDVLEMMAVRNEQEVDPVPDEERLCAACGTPFNE